MFAKSISFEIVNKLLEYDPESGFLYWKVRDCSLFKSNKQCAYWNKRYSGKKAGRLSSNGYLQISIFDKLYYAHRLVMMLILGKTISQDDEVDHINGVRVNNKKENLRLVDKNENGKNQKTPDRNSSGHIGVRWHKRAKKWISNITCNSKLHHIGYFNTIEDAVIARNKAHENYKFHDNHGR